MRGLSESHVASGPSDHGEWAISDQERQAIIQLLERIGNPGARWLFMHNYNPAVQTSMQPYIEFMRRCRAMPICDCGRRSAAQRCYCTRAFMCGCGSDILCSDCRQQGV